MNIPLTPETIQIAKEILFSGKHFKPFDEFFKASFKITAKHILFEKFVEATNCQIPKLFIYIVMDDLYGPCTKKDEHGDLGYNLTFDL
jgi:hypothetical protein